MIRKLSTYLKIPDSVNGRKEERKEEAKIFEECKRRKRKREDKEANFKSKRGKRETTWRREETKGSSNLYFKFKEEKIGHYAKEGRWTHNQQARKTRLQSKEEWKWSPIMHLKRMMVNKPEPESEEENAELSKSKSCWRSTEMDYQIVLNMERIRVPEILQPSIIGVEQMGLTEAISCALYSFFRVNFSKIKRKIS